MPKFKPTYLYIKKHSITGLKYFGKTINDPIKYLGSGIHWQYHIKKHGKEHVDTIWYHLFETKEELVEFAELFSEECCIVESSEWANLKPENGLDGGWETHTQESKDKMSSTRKGLPKTQEHKAKLALYRKGKTLSEETKKKISASQKGKFISQEQRDKVSKKYTVTNPEGISFDIIGLTKFCKENNLIPGKMCDVANGKQHQHKGWKCKHNK